MDKLKIEVIKLGSSKHKEVWKYIKNLKKKNSSKIFEIVSIKEVSLSNTQSIAWGYSDAELVKKIGPTSRNYDIRIAFIDYPLEGNYFVRRLDANTGVVTFYEADELLDNAKVSLNNYVLLKIYISCAVYYRKKDDKTFDADELFHHETRGCLFDMTGIKKDLIYSVTAPLHLL